MKRLVPMLIEGVSRSGDMMKAVYRGKGLHAEVISPTTLACSQKEKSPGCILHGLHQCLRPPLPMVFCSCGEEREVVRCSYCDSEN
mmetsp:Transcript_37457/g.99562  ORF Transcript_37457/g.99562 Transcript_37457/m.99562 type:complete len:86 (-) Transcript_37457:247-504(-)